MDVYKALRELHDEKKRLDSAILALEARLRTISQPDNSPRPRRGRRSMGVEERLEVSRRMSRYWAERRAIERPQTAGIRHPAPMPMAGQAIEGAA